MKSRSLVRYLLPLVVVVAFSVLAMAQEDRVATPQLQAPEAVRDGEFVITVKNGEKAQIRFDELVRDRDLDPSALYRVKTGGYLAFDEAEWVDKIEFKLFEKPVTELPQYRRYAELLKDINDQVAGINAVLAKYDLLALRLMNMCDKSRFPNLNAVDENILQQLTVYRKLVLLRALVANSMNRLVAEQACPEKIAQYSKTLEIYARQMTELGKGQELITKRALALTGEVDASRQPTEK